MGRHFKKGGFTLIELLLTVVIISAGMLGIMTLFENAVKGSIESDMNVAAANLAHEKLEKIVIDKVRDGYAALNQTSYPNEDKQTSSDFTGDFSIYTRNTTIVEVAGNDLVTPSPGSGYKRVQVKVSWGPAASKMVIVPTILANY